MEKRFYKIFLPFLLFFLLLSGNFQGFCQQVNFSVSSSLMLRDTQSTGREQNVQGIQSPVITMHKAEKGNVSWQLTLQGTDFTGTNFGQIINGSLLKYTKTGNNISGEFTNVTGSGGFANLQEPQYTGQSVKSPFVIISGRFQNQSTDTFQYIPMPSNFTLILPGDVAADSYTSTVTITFTQL
jgi:hypothetical protein